MSWIGPAHMRPRGIWAARVALALYLVPLARFTLWPEASQRRTWDHINAASRTASSGQIDVHATEMLANIVMFIPFGVLAIVVLRRASVALAAALALSGAIELAQHFWLPSRQGSVRDVALNVLGAAFGCVLVEGGSRLVRARRRALPGGSRPTIEGSAPRNGA